MVWPTINDLKEDTIANQDTQPLQQKAMKQVNFLDHICELDITSKADILRKCGIICTIGPASREPEMLIKLMEQGMNIARLNFSHGTHEYHAETIRNCRLAAEMYSKQLGMMYPLGIALDTKGPEIRTGLLEGGGSAEVELKTGEIITLTIDKAFMEKGNVKQQYVDYDNITKVVQAGNRIYVDDGLISLVCKENNGTALTCTIENGGMLGSKKGINVPGVPVDLPAVSEKDKSDFQFGVEQKVDMIFASFIRNASALTEIRQILGEVGKSILIISKIESQQGMTNIDEIIEASDGIMVARGDLGIEIPTEKVFLAQKSIIAKCNRKGKPVVCATQMLESMTHKPRPTRAEASDVANACLDGAHCVMLSGETAKGEYPDKCVEVMSAICKEAESAMWHRQVFRNLAETTPYPADAALAVAIAATEASIHSMSKAIIVITTSGLSAQMISKYKPLCPILAVSRLPQICRRLHLYRGIVPIVYEKPRDPVWSKDVDNRVEFALEFGKNKGFLKGHDPVVVITGWRQGSGFINTMRVIYVEDASDGTCTGPCT